MVARTVTATLGIVGLALLFASSAGAQCRKGAFGHSQTSLNQITFIPNNMQRQLIQMNQLLYQQRQLEQYYILQQQQQYYLHELLRQQQQLQLETLLTYMSQLDSETLQQALRHPNSSVRWAASVEIAQRQQ